MVSLTLEASVCLAALALAACLGPTGDEPVNDARYTALRRHMVETQIRARGVRNARVLEVLERIPRHRFVRKEDEQQAYGDHPIEIGYGQTISQPYIVAYMTEALSLGLDDRVLEVGTGSGYQAAVLGALVREVYTIEIVPELAQGATSVLRGLGYGNVHVREGDGYAGWADHAPFDAVIVTAAPDHIPQPLVDQLKVGGRLVVPVGRGDQDLLVLTRTTIGLREETRLPVRFVPLTRTPPV